MLINKVAILGVGLIGGSLARALRRQGVCENIIGFGNDESQLKEALTLGVIDKYALDCANAVEDADVVVLATPLCAMDSLFSEFKDAISADAVITDVGSSKASVIGSARKYLSSEQLGNFIPGHPVAGTEKSGVEASFAELFENRLVILTPLPETREESKEFVSQIWESIGATVVSMDIEHHDEVLAATSHLPHMLAYALVDCLASMQERDEIFKYAAGGFTDFTRIASSNPQMWNDVCISNRENLIKMLDRFGSRLKEIKSAIGDGDSDALLQIFTRAKNMRDEFIEKRSGSVNPGK